jgi:hypothetical protein
LVTWAKDFAADALALDEDCAAALAAAVVCVGVSVVDAELSAPVVAVLDVAVDGLSADRWPPEARDRSSWLT